jgi:hypothetical protein
MLAYMAEQYISNLECKWIRYIIHFFQVVFMPVSDNILACFQDDAVRIWKFDTFECIKEILPEVWKGHHLKSVAFTRGV